MKRPMFACIHGAEWPTPWRAAECECYEIDEDADLGYD